MKLSRSFSLVCLSLIICSASLGQKRPSHIFDPSPFQVTNTKLPPWYLGHSLMSAATALAKWQAIAGKGEFETTADYERRLLKHKQTLLFGRIRFNDRMAFSIGPRDNDQLTASYDADRSTLNVSVRMNRELLFEGGRACLYRDLD